MKEHIKRVLIRSRLLKAVNQLTRQNITILRYHAVQDFPEETDATVGAHIMHTTAVFTRQMEMISRQYQPLTMDDLADFVEGRKEFSKNAVVVTFDDGYTDNYEVAAPILQKYGIPATFYITVNTIGNRTVPWFIRTRHALWSTPLKEWTLPADGEHFSLETREQRVAAMRRLNNDCVQLAGEAQEKFVSEIENSLEVEPPAPRNRFMMDWEQVTSLKNQGHIIGSHTLTHPNLAKLALSDMQREIAESKRIIDEKLSTNTVHFSYPNPGLTPQWNAETTQALKKAGYKTAVLSRQGAVYRGDDLLSLKRAAVPFDIDEFSWVLDWTLIGREM